MKIRFGKMAEGDREAVIDLFNYYIENSFAAYPEETVPYGFFDRFLKLTAGYPTVTVRDEENSGRFVGFAFLRPIHPLRTLRSVLFALAIPCSMASSKLLVEVALISETLATDI